VLKNPYAWTIITKQNTSSNANVNVIWTFTDSGFVNCLSNSWNTMDADWNNKIQLTFKNNNNWT